MTALIIIGAIILVLVAIAFVQATVYVSYRDEVVLFLRIAGIKIGILPKKEKKIKTKKLSAKKYRKLLQKQRAKKERELRKKRTKRQKKQEQKLADKKKDKKPTEGHKKNTRSFTDNVYLVREIISVFFSRFGKHFRIKLARLNLTVASDDAAKTALMCGICAQSVAYILEFLDNKTNLDYNKNTEINVNVDYLSEKPSADIDISFSLRVWHLFDILIRVAAAAIKKYFNK